MLGLFFLLVFGAIGIVVYFVPMIVAIVRQHPNMFAITILNLLAGWTFFGWVAAMVWSCTAIPPRRY